MKRFAVCFVLVAFLISGCAAGITSIRPDGDLKINLSILMREVEKVEPDGLFRCLSIPDKNVKENKIEYVIYKHIEKGTWGFGVTDREQSIVWGYTAERDFFFYMMMGQTMMISEEQFKEALQSWIEVIYREGDISKAKRFDPVVPRGTDI